MNRGPKIALLSPEFPPFTIGGISAVCYDLANSLSKAGISTTVFCGKSKKLSHKESSEEIREVGEEGELEEKIKEEEPEEEIKGEEKDEEPKPVRTDTEETPDISLSVLAKPSKPKSGVDSSAHVSKPPKSSKKKSQ